MPQQNLYHHFEQLIELPLSKHQHYFEQHIACDIQLAELKGLLACHYEDNTKTEWHELITNQVQEVTGDQHIDDLLGTILGPYKLVKEIGQGGMGVVFLAKRIDGTMDQQVAIKFLYPSVLHLVGSDVGFNQAQILAKLNHPNITSVLDAGKTDAGLYYVVMEYVQGLPIDEYCQQHQLSFSERLALFLTVCDAISKTHVINIAHTDIKPSNILVSTDGLVKVLDFDIARTTEQNTKDNTDKQQAVKRYLRALSVNFASPEQLKAGDISLATDQYSLAVLLYVLLQEEPPFTHLGNDGQEVSIDVIVEAIYQGNKQRLSLSNKSLQLTRLERYFYQNDLNLILAKAMNPDASQRYMSVQAFKSDIHRAVANHVTDVQQNKPLARLIKWLYRSPAFAALYLILLTGGGALAYQNIALEQERNKAVFAQQVAEKEKQNAEQVSTQLANIFSQADPRKTNKKELTASDLLAQGYLGIQNAEGLSLETRYQLVSVLVESLYGIGDFQKIIEIAEPLLQENSFYLLDVKNNSLLVSHILESYKYTDNEDAANKFLTSLFPDNTDTKAIETTVEIDRLLLLLNYPDFFIDVYGEGGFGKWQAYLNEVSQLMEIGKLSEDQKTAYHYSELLFIKSILKKDRLLSYIEQEKNIRRQTSIANRLLDKLKPYDIRRPMVLVYLATSADSLGIASGYSEKLEALYSEFTEYYGEKHLFTNRVLHGLVFVTGVERKWQKNAKYALKENQVIKDHFGENDDYLLSLEYVAWAYLVNGDIELAKHYYEELEQSIYQQIAQGSETSRFSTFQNLMGIVLNIYVHLGEFKKAQLVSQHYDKLLNNHPDNSKAISKDVDLNDIKIAQAILTGEYKTASNYLNKTIDSANELIDSFPYFIQFLFHSNANDKVITHAKNLRTIIMDGRYLYYYETYFQDTGFYLVEALAKVGHLEQASQYLQELYNYNFHINPAAESYWMQKVQTLKTTYNLDLVELPESESDEAKLVDIIKAFKKDLDIESVVEFYQDKSNYSF